MLKKVICVGGKLDGKEVDKLGLILNSEGTELIINNDGNEEAYHWKSFVIDGLNISSECYIWGNNEELFDEYCKVQSKRLFE